MGYFGANFGANYAVQTLIPPPTIPRTVPTPRGPFNPTIEHFVLKIRVHAQAIEDPRPLKRKKLAKILDILDKL